MNLNDQEVLLRDLAYQSAEIFPERQNLEKRVKLIFLRGYWRVLGHLVLVVKQAVGSLSLGSYASLKKVNADVILVTASGNQLNLARRLVPFLKTESKLHLHYSGWQNPPPDVTPISVPIRNLPSYFSYLLISLWQNRKELSLLHWKTRIFCLEKICEIFLLKYFLERTSFNPNNVIIFTDLSPFGNLTAKFFHDKAQVIYIPHAPVLHNHTPPTFYDVVIGMSPKDMQDRIEKAEQNKKTFSEIQFHWSDFTVLKGATDDRSSATFLGICLKPEDDLGEVMTAFKENSTRAAKLLCRPHPMYQLKKKEMKMLQRNGVELSDPRHESSHEFIERCAVLVGRDSGLFAEALSHDRQIRVLVDEQFTDNYRIQAKNGVTTHESWSSIARDISAKPDWSEHGTSHSNHRLPKLSSLEDIFVVDKG